MKELSIEEKAKRYDEAIKRAKSKLHYPDRPCFVNVTEIFPELKESEEEKTRKEIVEFLKKNLHLDWAIWLEKQGERKSADKVEPTAWSEEDEKKINNLIDYFNHDDCLNYDGYEISSWLRTIKPQPHWKPSEEQLNNILDVLSFDNCTLKRRELLESLYNDLQKLKG